MTINNVVFGGLNAFIVIIKCSTFSKTFFVQKGQVGNQNPTHYNDIRTHIRLV